MNHRTQRDRNPVPLCAVEHLSVKIPLAGTEDGVLSGQGINQLEHYCACRAPAEAGAVSLRIYFGRSVAPFGAMRFAFANRAEVVECINCAGDPVTILDHVFGVCVLAFGEHVSVCTFIMASCRTRLWRVRRGLQSKPHQGRVMCKLHCRPCLRPSAAAGRSPAASADSLRIYYGLLSHSPVASALRLAEQAASGVFNVQTALTVWCARVASA